MNNKDKTKATNESFGKWAGAGYIIGNVAMMSKGVIDQVIDGQDINLESVYSDPLTLATGILYTLSSASLLKWGDKHGGLAVSTGFGLVGTTTIIYDMISKNYDANAIFGSVVLASAMVYGMYQGIKGHFGNLKSEPEKPVETREKKSSFKDNVLGLVKKYPYSPLGLTELTSYTLMTAGAIGSKDPVLAGISVVWGVAAGLICLSQPKAGEQSPTVNKLETIKP